MAKFKIENEEEEKGKGGQGNKNALAYGLLAGAGVKTEGMSPSDAWALVDAMKLMDRQNRKKTPEEKQSYKDKNNEAKAQGESKNTIIEKARKIAKSVALHSRNLAGEKEAVQTVFKLIKEYNLNKLQRLATKKHIGNGIKSAEAEANGATLNISRAFLNNPSAFYRNAVQDYGGQTMEDIKAYEEMLKDNSLSLIARSSIESELKNLKKREPYSRHNVCYKDKEVESVILHEMGHAIADQYCGQLNGNTYMLKGVGYYTAKKKRDLIEKVYKESMQNGDIYKISKYASENSKEFFAESFCMYKMGQEELPKSIKAMIEGVLKR